MEEKNTFSGKNKKIDLDKLKHTGAVAVPSMFTMANMGCGFFALLSASEGDFVRAAWLIVFSYIMDMLDGRVARALHGDSKLGIELDSFADWMSFGIAPAYIMFRMILKDLGFWGYAIAFFYVLCGLLRLARFNLKALADENSHEHFQGLPIPGAAGVIIALVLNYSQVESLREGIWASMTAGIFSAAPVIVPILALLMVSSVPFPAKKGNGGGARRFSKSGLILITALIVLIISYPRETLLAGFLFYVLYGVIAAAWNMARSSFVRKKEQ